MDPKLTPADRPAIAIVICTLNRCTTLRRAVDAMRAIETSHNWELVIVNNGSTDETPDYLAIIRGERFGHCRVLAVTESKRGLAASRNRGWRSASASLVAFTDDDCYVAKDYVDAIFSVFEENPAIGCAAGRILLFDPSDHPTTVSESETRRDLLPRTYIAAGTVHGANMAFRRAALETIGGFDERLGAGTPFPSEDVDAFAAAIWSGMRGVYDPRPLVLHHHGRKTGPAVARLQDSYHAGRGAYFFKYVSRADSRKQYVLAWTRSVAKDCLTSSLRGRIPQRSIRELAAALHFARDANKANKCQKPGL